MQHNVLTDSSWSQALLEHLVESGVSAIAGHISELQDVVSDLYFALGSAGFSDLPLVHNT